MAALLTSEFAWLLLGVISAGLFAGLIGGLFGIGGGIVIVPALYAVFGFVGVPDAVRIKVAVGTSLATIIITSIRSISTHAKKGAVDFTLLKQWSPWIALGAILGTALAKVIEAHWLTLIFASFALLIGIQKYIQAGKDRAEAAPATSDLPMPPLGAAASLGIFTGLSSALLGIGGGVIGVMILTHFRRTIHQAVATAAGFGFAIAVPGTLGMMIAGWQAEGLPALSFGFINLPAFVVISIMTFMTAPIGANLAHSLDKTTLTRIFGGYLLLTAAMLFREAF